MAQRQRRGPRLLIWLILPQTQKPGLSPHRSVRGGPQLIRYRIDEISAISLGAEMRNAN